MQRDVQRNQRSVFCQTIPLCPLAWTPDSSPRSLQKTEKLKEASRNCGGSESKPSGLRSLRAFAILSSANSLDLCIYRTGLDAASPAAQLRSMTRNWANSKEEASDLQPVPDWPDQQTPGTPPHRACTCEHADCRPSPLVRSSSSADSSCLVRNPKLPFAKWSTEQVCEWLEEIGLGQYVIVARHWVTGGQTLLSATPQELERVEFCRNDSFDASVRLINDSPSRSVPPVRSLLLCRPPVCLLVMPASGFQPAG